MIAKEYFNSQETYDQVLFETENFKVIPSLGSLVEGWLLVIPKNYYINYGQIRNVILLEELNELIQYVCEIVKKQYGNYVMFEHGPSEERTKVGCGVDYAHIHIVPINLTCDYVTLFDRQIKWEKINGISSVSKYTELSQAYLYFQDNYHNSYIGLSTYIPSQFFRRIIANVIGKPEMFDWKNHYFLDNIKSACFKLEPYKQIGNFNKLTTYA